MLTNPGSYPVRVSYFPHPAFKFVDFSASHGECFERPGLQTSGAARTGS